MGLALAVLVTTQPAEATYTIIGVDTVDGLVGAAGTSCVSRTFGWSLHDVGYAAVPGVGVIAAQGWFGLKAEWGQLAYSLMQAGAPSGVLGAALAYIDALGDGPDIFFDNGQFASVSLTEDTEPNAWLSQFTNGASQFDTIFGGEGGHTSDQHDVVYKGNLLHAFRYAIQGNLITDVEQLLFDASKGFEKSANSRRRTLGRRLSDALFYGGQHSGDIRCVDQQAGQAESIPGDSAFLRLDDANGPLVQIRIDHSCPSDAQYVGSASQQPCFDPTRITRRHFSRCRRHMLGVMQEGEEYHRYDEYLTACFVHYDGRDNSLVTGEFVPSNLEVNIL